MKRLCALFLTLAVILSLFAVAAVPTQAATVLAEGIDVSYWQGGNINWTSVASHSHGDFAILRAYCYGKDQYFDVNYTRAKQAGVPVGAYAYIYGTTTAAVQAEVNALLSVIAGKKFEYPIYIDIEDTNTYAGLGRQTVTNLVATACQMLENAGYFAGVYTYTSFAASYIYMDQLTNYTTWIADYRGYVGYTGSYAMWQYGCEGSVGGISPVDVNYCYTDFPTIIKKVGLNNYPANSDGDTDNDTNTDPSGIVAKGIDVSKWQMPVDWKAVAADPNVDYAIIRVTWSGLETTEWATFYPGAKEAGIPIGCYAYTMAATVEDAKKEAQATVELLKDKQFEYPIYIDAEEPGVYDSMDKATLTAIIKAECEVLRDAGYMAGVYSNTNYATNKIDMSQLSEYAVWIADYRGYNGYAGEYGMWQYTSTGSVNGISGNVDMNYCYVDYPTYIKENGLNGYEKEVIPEPTPDPSLTKFYAIKDQLPAVELIGLDHAGLVEQLKTAYDEIPNDVKALLTGGEDEFVTAAVEKIEMLRYIAKLGDVDEDGSLSAKDALCVLRYSVGKQILSQSQLKAAEVDGKEGINAKDALEILKRFVGTCDHFPIVDTLSL